MTAFKRSLMVALGIAALAIPAGAIAGHGASHGKAKGKAKTHNVAYMFKGFYAGDSSVDVKHGNAHTRKAGLIGETVAFDLSDARIVVADSSGDGTRSLDDVATGDWVLVKARLPRKDPGSAPLDARKLIDKTNHPGNGNGNGNGS